VKVDPRASAVIADAADPPELLQACLEGVGLWSLLADRSKEAGVLPQALRIVIKPDLSAFAAGAPTATDPRLVEGLIDTLQRRGFGSVALAASEDSSAVWAENRSVPWPLQTSWATDFRQTADSPTKLPTSRTTSRR
jgi:hypothetical protein